MSIHKPTTREEFKQFCLRRLGAPVIDINIDNLQIEDCVEVSLQYYRDYHFDGTEEVLYKHQVTALDKTNKYVTLPESMVGVRDILDIGGYSTNNMFNLRYQIHLNDLFNYAAGNIAPYVEAMRYLETMQENFVGKKPIRFNRNVNRLHIDMDWEHDIQENHYLIIIGYQTVDPEVYSDVWNDRWLLRYCTAQMKKQWGDNLTKFVGIQLPGGMQFNGELILNAATEEISKLEEEIITSYSLPNFDMTG